MDIGVDVIGLAPSLENSGLVSIFEIAIMAAVTSLKTTYMVHFAYTITKMIPANASQCVTYLEIYEEQRESSLSPK